MLESIGESTGDELFIAYVMHFNFRTGFQGGNVTFIDSKGSSLTPLGIKRKPQRGLPQLTSNWRRVPGISGQAGSQGKGAVVSRGEF